MKLDVIIPAYNEEGSIEAIYKALTTTLEKIKYNLIFINDGSTDKTGEILNDIYNNDKKHVKVINFSRNFGRDAAVYAGLKKANAEYTSIIDADMQQPPKYILEMMDVLENDESYDEVAMVNQYQNYSPFQRHAKKVFYWTMTKLTGLKFQIGASEFRLFRRQVVKAVLEMSEKNRFSKGLFSWVGFRIKYLEYNALKRTTGESKFKLKKQIDYATDGIINFSTKPLRIISALGLITTVIAFISLIIILIKSLVSDFVIPGYPTIMCAILFIGGIQTLMLGVMSEYISRIHVETKNRPIYIEKSTLGFEDDIL